MSTREKTEKITVFYHDPCLDGAAAAWAAHRKWGDDAQYIGINHASLDDTKRLIFDNIDEDTHVIFADYTPPREIMDEIADKAKKITIYDHHATAIRNMKDYRHDKVKTVFDERRSGGAIVYGELFPEKKLPQVIKLAQMIDLEEYEREDFFPIAAYLDFNSLPLGNIEDIVDSLDKVNGMRLKEIVDDGEVIRRSRAPALEKAMDSMAWTKISIWPGTDPVYVPIINANLHHLGREFSFRLRDLAAHTAGSVALSWHEDKGIVYVSVRTDGLLDAGEVAKHIGQHGIGEGGGHLTSGGAQFSSKQFNRTFERLTKAEVIKGPGVAHKIDNPTATSISRKQQQQQERQ